MWHKAEWMGRLMRLELTRVGLFVQLANCYTTRGPPSLFILNSFLWKQKKNSESKKEKNFIDFAYIYIFFFFKKKNFFFFSFKKKLIPLYIFIYIFKFFWYTRQYGIFWKWYL